MLAVETGEWWAWEDSNLQPVDYEPNALTIELQARRVVPTIPRLVGRAKVQAWKETLTETPTTLRIKRVEMGRNGAAPVEQVA